MIIVRLKGGFANQLFQYAAGRSLSILKKSELFFDLTYLQADPGGAYTKRDFGLHEIHHAGKMADAGILEPYRLKNGWDRFVNKIGMRKHLVFNENSMNYMPLFDSLPDNVLLNGYWQSEKYFSRIRSTLIKEISPNYDFTPGGKKMLDDIRQTNSVAVHVRRGDYVNLPQAAEWHGSCDPAYYKRARQYLSEKEKDLRYFIFSDDIDWCKKNFQFFDNAIFVENEPEKKSSQDLFIMSAAKHLIMANSSYSWWAAWLSDRAKTVIAPANWYKKVKTPEDLYPAHWLKIQ